jgi:hypothetical protein
MEKLSSVGRRVRRLLAEWNDFGDGPVAIEDEDGSAVTNVIEVPREIVLEVGDLGPFHMAMLAHSSSLIERRGQVAVGRHAPATHVGGTVSSRKSLPTDDSA